MQTPEDKQVSFVDWALAQRTRPNEVLEKITALVDLSEAEGRLEATYSELGRPGHRAAVLLRVALLQHLYGLSDPQAEAQLADRLSFQKFAGLRADEPLPDETAICRFRQRLIQAGLQEQLLDLLNAQLAEAGYLVRRTTLVDATLVESSRQRPDPTSAREGKAPDAEARYTRKYGKSYYGYKAHLSVDGDNQLISQTQITGADTYDGEMLTDLVTGPTRAVYADKAYDSKANRTWLAERGVANGILKKAAHHIRLGPADHRRNARKARRRRAIERVFAHLKHWFGYRRVRYLGLIKNQLELTLKAVAYNLRRLVSLAAV